MCTTCVASLMLLSWHFTTSSASSPLSFLTVWSVHNSAHSQRFQIELGRSLRSFLALFAKGGSNMAAQITPGSQLTHLNRHRSLLNGASALSHHRPIRLTASLAELMLVNRLRARTRRDLALDTLQRAADMIELTAKNWFVDSVSNHDE